MTDSHAVSDSDFAESIGLSDLQLAGTPSGASDPPIPMHPPSLTRQLGDRDDFGRIYIVPVARGPDGGVRQMARICISRYFNGYWTSWKRVSKLDRKRMFEEFKKLVKPKWIPEPIWPLYQRHRNSPEYQLLREKGKRDRASSKGGSLHIAGARSTLAVKEKLLFEETHLRKKKNLTDEDVWVEPHAKAVHDEFRRLIGEYHSSQPPESQGDPIPQHVQNELWTKSSGPANRCHFYGCHTEFFGDNIRCSSGPAYSISLVDTETIVRLQNMVFQLIEESAEQRERYAEPSARKKKTEEATSSQIRMLQQQFSSFIQTARVIPPCPGDAVRATKGLGPLDDFSTDDDMEDEDEFDDDDC
ncbi:hypothetical protein P3S68_004343 [Capsicum galapagoense]